MTTAATVPADDPSGLPIAPAREAWAWTRRAAGRQPIRMALVVLTTVLASLAGLVAPYVVGVLVDRLPADGTPRLVVLGAVAVAAAAVLGGLLTWVALRTLAQVGEAAVAELREDVVSRALTLDAQVVETAGPGDLVSRVSDDARLVAEATTEIVPVVCTSALPVAVSAVALVAVDWRLGLIGLTAIPMYWLSLRWYLPRSGPWYAAERAAFAERAGHLLGGLSGAATLQAYGPQELELRRIDAASARARDLGIGVYRLLTLLFGRNNRAEAVVLILILGAGFGFVAGGWVSAGAVATAALLFHRLFNPLGAIVVLFDEVQSAAASLTRLVGVAGVPVATVRTELPDRRPTVLRAEGVGHRYATADGRAGTAVLIAVDLVVHHGETVALVGSTGAGKTTLANAMAGILTPSAGACRLDEVGVRDVAPSDLRRRVQLVSQEVHTFAGPVRDDVALARPAADDEAVWTALRLTGADGWVAALPDGLATVVGEGGHRLSAVQGQQLALARVALADPDFVVLDEATAEAGSSGSRALEAAAAAVVAGRGALVVAHRLSQARQADRIVVLEHGRVVEQGQHTDLVDAGGRYAQLWRAWSAHTG